MLNLIIHNENKEQKNKLDRMIEKNEKLKQQIEKHLKFLKKKAKKEQI